MKKKIKVLAVCLLPFVLAAFLLCGTTIREGVKTGLSLSYTAVLPALFPSMILCGMIGEYTHLIPLPPAITIWLTSQICGFPLGIRLLSRSHRCGLLSRKQTVRLSTCCSNASPAFLILYVGDALLKNRTAGIRLFLGQIIASASIGIALGAFEKSDARSYDPEIPLLTAFCNSVSAAASGCLVLTAYISAFSVFGVFLKERPFLYALLEITGGLSAIDPRKTYLIAAAVGFSGLSVMMQNSSYLVEEKLSVYPMFLSKIGYMCVLPFLLRFPQIIWIPPFFAFFFDKWRKKQYNVKKERTGVAV